MQDPAWTPIATASAGDLEKISSQIDALIKEATTPKPVASPTPAPSPSATVAPPS